MRLRSGQRKQKAAAVTNILTGGLSLFINFLNLVQWNYYAAGTGLLFCFTYLFVATMNLLFTSYGHKKISLY